MSKLLLCLAMCTAIGAYGQYPNPELTPGKIRTTDATETCSPQFSTGKYRKTTEGMKREAFRRYGVCNGGLDKPCRKAYEVDHVVPLELGGADDVDNLWPQAYRPIPGAHQKDLVENHLRKQVCAGTIELIDAQRQIRMDWLGIYNIMSLSDRKAATWHR